MPLFCYFRFSPFQICVYHFLMNWHLHVFEYSRNILLQQWKIMMWKLLKVRNKFVIILLYISIRTGLKPIEPIAPNWTRAYSRLFIYTLQVIQRTTIEPTSTLVFSCTHCRLYRERLLSPRLLSSVHVHTAGYTENDHWTRAYSRLFMYTLQVIQRTTIEPAPTLLCSCTHCRLYRERQLNPAPPKARPWSLLSNFYFCGLLFKTRQYILFYFYRWSWQEWEGRIALSETRLRVNEEC